MIGFALSALSPSNVGHSLRISLLALSFWGTKGKVKHFSQFFILMRATRSKGNGATDSVAVLLPRVPDLPNQDILRLQRGREVNRKEDIQRRSFLKQWLSSASLEKNAFQFLMSQ